MKKAIHHLKQADPILAEIMERTGPCKMSYREPTFQSLVRSIVYQQLHGKAALSIFTRLEKALGTGGVTPEAILKLRPQKMRSLGLSRGKTTYIRELARATRDGHVHFESLTALSDGEVIEQLTQVKGIGVWTSHMFLMFALRRPNILPVGDLGVRMAMKKAYALADLPKPAEMEKIAAVWHPYCSIASWYMWRSLEGAGEL